MADLRQDYPWVRLPLIACAPMRLIALAPLAVEVSRAGGIGFVGAGSDTASLSTHLKKAHSLLSSNPLPSRSSSSVLPIGVGFLNWGADLPTALAALKEHTPAAVWFFAPRKHSDLVEWTQKVREATGGKTKVWIQVGTVASAVEVTRTCSPDVLVVQGSDAGGHGLERGAGVVSLLPEVGDTLKKHCAAQKLPALMAAGGIVEGRGVAASLVLGADGVVMGTRYLAAEEADISKGYSDEVLRASDGGANTVRSKVYDSLRGTTDWPEGYNGRGIINQSYRDSISGMDLEKNKGLYAKALETGDAGWGVQGRLTTYAGTGVGLVTEMQSAKQITEEVREEAKRILGSFGSRL
ncbi:hypothetical protein BJ546DRAFT_918469 [Cryomyces antarcticus]